MSRGTIALLGIAGAMAGAYVGMPFLNDGAQCQAASEGGLQCQLNQVHLPFLSAITLGMVAAIAVGSIARHIARHGLRSAPERRQTKRAAVEVDDPYLQLASWGLAPHGERRVMPRGMQAGTAHVARSEDCARQPRRRAGLNSRGRPVPTPPRP